MTTLKVGDRCIFCGNRDLTKEHIFPKWMHRYLPAPAINHECYTEVIHPTLRSAKVKKRSGGSYSGRIRCVCKTCNNGWMSQLQEQTKPILLQLMDGKPITLFRRQQELLAAWIAMFTMVSEFRNKDPIHIAISQQDRDYLLRRFRPPRNWRIWIGRCVRGGWGGVYVHNTLPIEDEGIVPLTTTEGIDLPNTQTTTFMIGELYVHVISSVVRSFVQRQRFIQVGQMVMPQVWQITNNSVVWPPTYVLTNRNAEDIASVLITSARRAIAARS